MKEPKTEDLPPAAAVYQLLAREHGERLQLAVGLLAEAREALSKFPVGSDQGDAWYRERAMPALRMIEEFLNPMLRSGPQPVAGGWFPRSQLPKLMADLGHLNPPDKDWPPLPDGEVPF